MARTKKGTPIHGWLNIHKTEGVTSTDVVRQIKRILKPQKIGHAGTLDPLASGVLPIALGEATKTVPFVQDHSKTYAFDLIWGEARTTEDAEGEVTDTSDTRATQDQILGVLPRFIGEVKQTPPAFSAIKIDGQRAYDLARAGEDIDIPERIVSIQSIDILSHSDDVTRLRVVCGKGTYVRALGRDIALACGSVGYIDHLVRESVGALTLNNAILLDKFEEIDDIAALKAHLLPLQSVLDDIPGVALSDSEAQKIRHGQSLTFISPYNMDRLKQADIKQGDVHVLVTHNNVALAITEWEKGMLKPVRVFNIATN